MKVIGLAGWSGAGKTTLIAKLIPALRARGLSVSTLKHAHHAFDVDTPGKDSYIHRDAGAREVLVASTTRWALMHELRGGEPPDLGTLIGHLAPVDLVLVEGFKRDAHAKIEVHRVANGKPFLFPGDGSIVALASDAPPPTFVVAAPPSFPQAPPSLLRAPPCVGLDDVDAILALAMAHAVPLDETRRRLAAATVP